MKARNKMLLKILRVKTLRNQACFCGGFTASKLMWRSAKKN